MKYNNHVPMSSTRIKDEYIDEEYEYEMHCLEPIGFDLYEAIKIREEVTYE